MITALRRFTLEDVPYKVRWINDPHNHQFLHYDLPLEEEATAAWFRRVCDLDTRLDMTIVCDGAPAGIIGLLQIDRKNEAAELYITVGEESCKGKGVAAEAMKQLLAIAFFRIGLHRVYLTTEQGNHPAVRAYDKFGFVREGCLRDTQRKADGSYAHTYVYSMLKEEFEERYGTDAGIADSVFGKKPE